MDEFDRFCEEHDISPEETPTAFAAWLNGATGWDGDMQPVIEEAPQQVHTLNHLFPGVGDALDRLTIRGQ